MLALMGPMSRQMLELYSHIRMAAKRKAVECLVTGSVAAGGVGTSITVGTTMGTVTEDDSSKPM